MSKKQANPVDVEVGNRLRIRRVLIGMSQEQLGNLLGLTFQQIQKYEKGINRIGAGRLFEAARALNVPVDFFYEGLAQGLTGVSEMDSAPTKVSKAWSENWHDAILMFDTAPHRETISRS